MITKKATHPRNITGEKERKQNINRREYLNA